MDIVHTNSCRKIPEITEGGEQRIKGYFEILVFCQAVFISLDQTVSLQQAVYLSVCRHACRLHNVCLTHLQTVNRSASPSSRLSVCLQGYCLWRQRIMSLCFTVRLSVSVSCPFTNMQIYSYLSKSSM